MNKKKAVMSVAAVGGAVAVVGVAMATYNSKPMRTRRMMKKAGRTMGNVGSMLTTLSNMVMM